VSSGGGWKRLDRLAKDAMGMSLFRLDWGWCWQSPISASRVVSSHASVMALKTLTGGGLTLFLGWYLTFDDLEIDARRNREC